MCIIIVIANDVFMLYNNDMGIFLKTNCFSFNVLKTQFHEEKKNNKLYSQNKGNNSCSYSFKNNETNSFIRSSKKESIPRTVFYLDANSACHNKRGELVKKDLFISLGNKYVFKWIYKRISCAIFNNK